MPVLWSSIFGGVTFAILSKLPLAMHVLFPVLWLFGTLSWYWFGMRLKKVRLDQDALLISNYFREVRVPLRDVTNVSGNRWVNTRQITVTFDRETGFGKSIVFMPKVKFLWPGQEHPAAQELRELVLGRDDIGPVRLWPS